MKRIIVMVIVLALILTGCGNKTEEKKSLKTKAKETMVEFKETQTTIEEANKITPKDLNNYDIYVWTDEETGVQYIIYSYKSGYGGMGGITPRLNSDGTVMIETK